MTKIIYPLNQEFNQIFDGQAHEITAHDLMQINETNIYLLYYTDKVLKNDMCTFLRKSNDGHFYNIPLYSYSKIDEKLQNLEFKTIEEYILGQNIKSESITSIDQLLLEIEIYKMQSRKNSIPVPVQNTQQRPNRFFANLGNKTIPTIVDGERINIPKNTSNEIKYEQSVEFICYDMYTNDLLAVFGEPKIEQIFNGFGFQYTFNESVNEEEFKNSWTNYMSWITQNIKKFSCCTTTNGKMYMLYFIPIYNNSAIERFTSNSITGVTVTKNRSLIEITPEILFKAVNNEKYIVNYETNPSFHT